MEFAPTFDQMDADRKEWLTGAMKEHFGENDESKLLREAALFLSRFTTGEQPMDEVVVSDEDLDKIAHNMEEVSYLIEDIDHAKDFTKMGGVEICNQLLKSNYSSLQWRSADVLASLTQNNMYCQSAAVKFDSIPTLLLTIASPNAVEIVTLKCVHALSQIVGNFKPSIIMFMRSGGMRLIVDHGLASREASVKLQIKTVLLLDKILVSVTDDSPEMLQMKAAAVPVESQKVTSKEFVVHEMLNLKVHETLIARVMPGDLTNAHEPTLALLLRLLNLESQVVDECKKPMYGLKLLFQDRIKTLSKAEEDAERWEDVVSMYRDALRICFPDCAPAS